MLLRLERGNLNAEKGNILNTNLIGIDGQTSFKTYVNKAKTQCEVCAKGALFCSLIGRVNKVTINDVTKPTAMTNYKDSLSHTKLLEYFTLEQLDLIECAFEGETYLYAAPIEKIEKAIQFGFKYVFADEKMIAIMKNIIKNKGTFKP